MPTAARAVVFDLGGVLIDWNPRHLYRAHFRNDEPAMERFLTTVCTQVWNEEQDAGRPFSDGVALLQRAHPEWAELIARYDTDWDQMLRGPLEGSLAVLSDLKGRGVASASSDGGAPDGGAAYGPSSCGGQSPGNIFITACGSGGAACVDCATLQRRQQCLPMQPSGYQCF